MALLISLLSILATTMLPAHARQESPSESAKTAEMIDTFFPNAQSGPNETCDGCRKPLPLNIKLTDRVQKAAPKATPRPKPKFSDVVDSLRPFIGECLLNKKRDFPRLNPHRTAYNQKVLKRWGEITPSAIGPDGNLISKIDLVSIDALARTLYGEMGKCFDDGIQYPMAVAKVALNRAEWIDANPNRRGRYGLKKEASEKEEKELRGLKKFKSSLTEVLTKSAQFSVWNREENGEPNNTLKHVLCPPASEHNGYYRGKKVPKKELKIWQQALEIATRAVLDTENFKKETKDIREYFYTSAIDQTSKGYVETETAVGEKRISDDACMMTWLGVDE